MFNLKAIFSRNQIHYTTILWDCFHIIKILERIRLLILLFFFCIVCVVLFYIICFSTYILKLIHLLVIYLSLLICFITGKTTNELLERCAMSDPAICPSGCGHFYKGINRKKLLRRHMVYECGTPSKFKCPICTKRFTRKSNMRTHVIHIHNTSIWSKY